MLADLIDNDGPEEDGKDLEPSNNPSSLDLASVVKLIISQVGRYIPDSLYPFISYVIDPATKALYVRKVHSQLSAEPEELTRIVAEAFEHQRTQVTMFGDTEPRVKVVRRKNKVTLDVEYVLGIETYTLNRQLKREMERTTNKFRKKTGYNGVSQELGELTIIRKALIQAQLTRLAEFQYKPYVPYSKEGVEIIDNPDLKAYYTASLVDIFKGERVEKSDDEIIQHAIRVITSHLPATDARTVRYLDMYPRNHAIKTCKLGADFSELREMIGRRHNDDANESKRTKLNRKETLLFMYRRLRHFDYNRVTKIAYDLEDFMHITDDPGLSLTLTEQWEYYKIFLATKQTLLDEEKPEPAKKRENERITTLSNKLTQMGRFTDDEIERLAPDVPIDRDYFLAMKAYRNLRKAILIERNYLAKYKERMAAAKEEIATGISSTARAEHAEEIDRFREKGLLKDLEFITRYLSNARINDSGLYATGIRFDPEGAAPDFYRLFDGDTEDEQKQNSLKAIVGLSRYIHARMRYNEYIRDRRSHLERADEALKELAVEKITQTRRRRRLRVRIGDSKYCFKVEKKRGVRIMRTSPLAEHQRYKEITGFNDYVDLYKSLGSQLNEDYLKAQHILEAYILKFVIRQKLEGRTYARQ